jgi:hypothetical protein
MVASSMVKELKRFHPRYDLQTPWLPACSRQGANHDSRSYQWTRGENSGISFGATSDIAGAQIGRATISVDKSDADA